MGLGFRVQGFGLIGLRFCLVLPMLLFSNRSRILATSNFAVTVVAMTARTARNVVVVFYCTSRMCHICPYPV